MFTRHLIAAAALMAATCAANADVITTTTTVTTASTLASDLSIVDTSTALSGADTGLAAVLASSNTSSQLVLVRGVEGLYMLASRANAPVQTAAAVTDTTAGTTTPPAAAAAGDASDIVVAAASTTVPASVNALVPVTDADAPVVNAAAVPEPATLTLMLAGVLGALAFSRARKQG